MKNRKHAKRSGSKRKAPPSFFRSAEGASQAVATVAAGPDLLDFVGSLVPPGSIRRSRSEFFSENPVHPRSKGFADGWCLWVASAISTCREDTDDGCSRWRSILTSEGYPQVIVMGKQYPAHRLAAALHYGPAALAGKDVHHECGNRDCVNPRHLVPVTPAEHIRAHKCGELPTKPPELGEDGVLLGEEVIAAVHDGATKRPRREAA